MFMNMSEKLNSANGSTSVLLLLDLMCFTTALQKEVCD